MVNEGMTKLFGKLDICCERGREGAVIKFLSDRLSKEGYAELLSLAKEMLSDNEGEPSANLKKEIRFLKKLIDGGLRKKRAETTPETDAMIAYWKLKGDKRTKPIAEYLLSVAVELGHPGAYLEMARNTNVMIEREYWLLKSMHGGCTEAVYRLAHFYRDLGNDERYGMMLAKAYGMGHAEAGYEYFDGLLDATARDNPVFGDILREMEEFANAHYHVKAMTKLAFQYGDSTCPFYDLDKAISFWERSARLLFRTLMAELWPRK